MQFRYLVGNEFIYYSFDELEDGEAIHTLANRKYIVRNQFIGARDKNNKPIYEDDILKINVGTYNWEETNKKDIRDFIFKDKFENKVVEFDPDSAEWGSNLYIYEDKISFEKTEVIGNIHQNPELLESCVK